MTFCPQCQTYLPPHLGACPRCGVARPLEEQPSSLWVTVLPRPPAGPVLCVEDRLLVADLDASVHALALDDGHLRWRRPFAPAMVTGIVPAAGLLLIATAIIGPARGKGLLVAMDADGEEQWRWSPPDVHRISAPVVLEEAVYVVTDGRTLHRLDVADGAVQWSLPLAARASLHAPLALADQLIIPCLAARLCAVSTTGESRWELVPDLPPQVWLSQTPAALDDLLFATSSDGVVLAFHHDGGRLVWKARVGPHGRPLSAPVAADGHVYVGAEDGLHALAAATGREAWFFPTPRPIVAAPVAVGGIVYAACHDHRLYALNAATGAAHWRYEVRRRIEVPPLILPTRAVIADRGGTVTALSRPLSAAEHEAAGHWVEAAAAYAAQGEAARGAALLEARGDALRAAELWKVAGAYEHAARQYEAAEAWDRAAEVWEQLDEPLRQAEALEHHARALLAQSEMHARQCAALWDRAASLYEAAWAPERAILSRREAARCLRRPIIAVELEHEGLVLGAETRLKFIVRNVGFGPARHLIIHAEHDACFEGEIAQTYELISLKAGQTRVRWLTIRPLRYGPSVPLRLRLEYITPDGSLYTARQTLYLPVARTPHERRPTPPIPAFLTGERYLDVEIRLMRREADGYPVEVTLAGQQHFPRGYVRGDLVPWAAEGNAVADGERLFAALFADETVRNAWEQAAGQSPLRRVRLRIDTDAAELHAIPWELMRVDGNLLAAHAHTPFSRYLPVDAPWGAVVAVRPLRILAVIASPSDVDAYGLTPLDLARERAALGDALAHLPAHTVQLDFLDPPVTLARLEMALQEGYHVLHYVGHGAYNARRRQAALYLEDEQRRTRIISDAALCDMVERQGTRPYLAFLAACQSAVSATDDAFRGLGPRLVAAGVPAVVAMQGVLSLASARELATVFYRRLAEHGVVDLAMNEARSLLLTEQRADVAVPVLFMRLKNGQLFRGLTRSLADPTRSPQPVPR